MAGPNFADAERRMSALAEAIEARSSSAESRKADDRSPSACQDTEAILEECAAVLDAIAKVDADWRNEIFGGETEYRPEDERGMTRLYQGWARMGAPVLIMLEGLERLGCRVVGAEKFRADLHEVQGILTPDGDFFDDEALADRQDAVIDAYVRGETVEFEEMGD